MTAERSTARTVVNVVGVLLLIGVVAPFVVYGFPQIVGADYGFVVLSGSMEPELSPGDAIIVREAAPGEIEARDVITFRTDSQTPTTHRVTDVIEREGTVAYVTKGDANEDPDSGTVPHERVLGEVFVTLPLLGYAVRFINTPLGFVVVVAGPLAAFVVSEVWSLAGSVDRSDSVDQHDSVDRTESDREGVVDDAAAVDAVTAAVDAEAANDAAGVDGAEPIGSEAAASTAESGEAATKPAGEVASAPAAASFTLTRSSVQLLGLVFAFYLPYSAYVAYTTVAAWTIAVAVATGIGLLFVGGLYLGMRGSDSDDVRADAVDESDREDDGEAGSDDADRRVATAGTESEPEFEQPELAKRDDDAVPTRSTAADGGSDVAGGEEPGDA
ncbi:signal peptidase I [Halobellus sp. Atlit-31R]|nr:signal peptidase I [Halobellus sp. Atlit-31R]